MKTIIGLAVLILSFCIDVRAQVIVQQAGSLPDAWSFDIHSPGDKIVWPAGSTQGIKFNSSGLKGYRAQVNLTREDQGGWYISTFRISGDGEDGDAFRVPFGMPSGVYQLQVNVLDEESWNWIPVGNNIPIEVASAVTSPAMGSTVKAGHACVVKWMNQDITSDWFTIYLERVNTYGEAVRVGTIPVRRGRAVVRIPRDTMPGTYRLRLWSFQSSSVTSDTFEVVNKRWPGNPGPSPENQECCKG